MHLREDVCVPPRSEQHHWGVSKERKKEKTANCMSTNVKEAPNNSLCKAQCCFGLQLWSSLSLTCSWSQVTDGEEGYTVAPRTLNIFLHGLTITLCCACVSFSACVSTCAGRATLFCPTDGTFWRGWNDVLSSTLLFSLSLNHLGSQGQENNRWTKDVHKERK